MIDRRRLIAGGALLAIGAVPARDAEARRLLDEAASLPPAARLSLLGRIDTAFLSRSRRLDVLAAVRGADLEARIAAASAADRYPLQLRLQAGFEISTEAAHRRAQRHALAFTRQVDRLLRAEGLARGSVADRLRSYARDPRFAYADSEAGRDEAVAAMNRWLAAARLRLASEFGSVPPAALRVAVVRMSPAEEAAGTAGYRSFESAGGAVPGAYHVDLHEIARRPSWSLPSVVHHEAVPGHMIQLPLQARAEPHPLRLKAAAGFVEGWAIYAEQLAAEAGAFAAYRPAAIGYCQWMLFRLGRSMIDTGINHLGWSRDHAIDCLAQLQGDAVIFAPFGKDVSRVSSEPGALAGQALNWLEIIRKRNAAIARARGADLRRFHDALLLNGAAPLTLL